MRDSGTGTAMQREYLGNGRPVVDREARGDALLVGDVAYPHCATEQRVPGAGWEDGGEGLEVDVGIWRDV